MKNLEIKPDKLIRCKGFDISIGHMTHQIALISHSSGNFTAFTAIRKGGRLSKIKNKFRSKLSSSTHFFFENMDESDIKQIIDILS